MLSNTQQIICIPDTSKHQTGPIQTISLSIKTIPGVPRRLQPSFRQIQDYSHFEIGQLTLLYLYFLTKNCKLVLKNEYISDQSDDDEEEGKAIMNCYQILRYFSVDQNHPRRPRASDKSKILTILKWWLWFIFVVPSFYIYLYLCYHISCFKICVFVFENPIYWWL